MTFIDDILKWDRRFVALAQHIAKWSKDPSTQVGCVVVGPDREIRSTGYNGFPRGVADDGRLADRDSKYPIIVHAEENAVAQAARIGGSLRGCTAFTWPLPACSKCARLLIQAGVSAVVYPEQDVPERWREDTERARALLMEAGVNVRAVAMKETDE